MLGKLIVSLLSGCNRAHGNMLYFTTSQEYYLGKLMKGCETLRYHGHGEGKEGRETETEDPDGHIVETSNRKALMQSLPQIQMVLCLQVGRL